MKVVERVLVACAVLVTLVALPLAGHAGGARLWATSPFVRIGADGAAVHVDLLPADRAAYERAVIHDEVRYHGGPTIDRSATYAIFWQPAGSYVSPKYQSTIAQFLTDVGATPAYGILTQYYDRDGYPQNASAFAGSWTDTSAYPSPFDDRSFRTEVVKAIVANGWPAGGIRPIFFIFTASKAPDRFAACAYHGAFAAAGHTIVYSPVPYQRDYGPHGCGTPSNVFPNDRDADLTIDTLWHELAEAVSDPAALAWVSDRTGAEIGDICNSAYGPIGKDGADVTLHGHRYVTQQIWSNARDHCRQTQ